MHEAAARPALRDAARLRDEINEPEARSCARSVTARSTRSTTASAIEPGADASETAGELDQIVIRGAREHNLKNVTSSCRATSSIVFTGLSGSGKSSLAFDTIYAEGQRRYVESLSSYARQFLGQMDKPDVDFIEGLSPAISIDQKSASRNPRSTVGTITEIYDYLRLLYARIGVPHCPKCGRADHPPDAAADRRPGAASSPRARASRCWRRSCGAARASTRRCSPTSASRASPGPGSTARSSSSTGVEAARPRLARYEKHTIEVVVDRLVRRPGIERRLTDSLETALRLAEGVAEVEIVARKDEDGGVEGETLTFSEHLACTHCGLSFDELAPRNFSFNSPYGACERCDGLGTRFEVDPELVVADDELSIDRRRHRPVGRVPGRVLRPGARRGGRRLRVLHVDAVEEAARPPTARSSSTARAASRCWSSTRTATAGPASVHHPLRGRHPLARAPPLRGGERPHPGADRGLHAGGAVPRVRRRPAPPGHRWR